MLILFSEKKIWGLGALETKTVDSIMEYCGVYYLTVLVYTKTTIHRSGGG